MQIAPTKAPAAEIFPFILGYYGSYLSQIYPPINSLGTDPKSKIAKYPIVKSLSCSGQTPEKYDFAKNPREYPPANLKNAAMRR